MPTSHHAARAGLLQISFAGVLWGTGGLGVQVIRDHAPLSVLTISAYRMLIASVVLVAAFLALRQLAAVGTLLRERPLQAFVVGACTAAYQALYFASVVAVGVTVSTVVSLGLAPLLLTVGESVARRSLPRRSSALVLFAALTGLVLVTAAAGTSSLGPHPALGILAAAGSGSAYALTTVLGRPLTRIAGPVALTTTTTTAGALVLVPFAALTWLDGSPVATSDPVALGTLAYLGVMTMALAYGLLYAGLRTTSGSAAVIATLLEPVTAAVVAALFLGERVGAVGVVGGLLILAAVGGLGRFAPARSALDPPVFSSRT